MEGELVPIVYKVAVVQKPLASFLLEHHTTMLIRFDCIIAHPIA